MDRGRHDQDKGLEVDLERISLSVDPHVLDPVTVTPDFQQRLASFALHTCDDNLYCVFCRSQLTPAGSYQLEALQAEGRSLAGSLSALIATKCDSMVFHDLIIEDYEDYDGGIYGLVRVLMTACACTQALHNCLSHCWVACVTAA